MAGFDIPNQNIRINPTFDYQKRDYAGELSKLMSGLGNAMGGQGSRPLTQKQQEQMAEQASLSRAAQALASDAAIQEKLNKLQTLPVAEARATLQDIRRNDVRRISEATGVDSSELYEAMLGPLQSQVNERYTAVKKDSGSLSSIIGGARMSINELAGAFRAIGKSDEEARAIGREVHQENEAIRQASPYWQDQMLRDQAGEMVTFTGETGSIAANIARMAPQMAGQIGGTLGGAAVGSLAGPVGTFVGGSAAAAALGAMQGSQDFITRVEMDPRLTEEQKAEAISTGRLPAAAAAGVFNAIPINANPASQALLRAASGNIIGKAANRLGQNLAGRVVGNTLVSGAELSVANAGDVLSRNAIFEQATGLDTPLTEGLGQALAQGAGMAPFFGAARSRTHSIPATEAPKPVVPDAPAADTTTPQAPKPPKAPDGSEFRDPRPVEMVDFDESVRAGFREGIQEKTITGPQAIFDAYVRDGRTVDDLRRMLDADVVASNPLGPKIVEQVRKLIPKVEDTKSLTPEAADFVTNVKQRVLNGEDLTIEQVNKLFTGDRGSDNSFIEAINSTLQDGYVERNSLTAELHRSIAGLGKSRSGGDPLTKFITAVNKYYDDGGNDNALNRYIEDASKSAKERNSVLSPAPGKLTAVQQSLLREAINRRAQEQTNGGSATPNMGFNDGQRTTGADTADTGQNSGRRTSPQTVVGDDTGTTMSTVSGSDGTTQGGRAGGIAQPDQRANQASNVPTEATGTRSTEGADTGRSTSPTTIADATASEGTGIPSGASVGDGGVAGATAATSRNNQSNGGDIGTVARDLGVDVETVSRVLEETGELPTNTDRSSVPFAADIPEGVKVTRLPDSATAIRIDNELIVAVRKDPKAVAQHLSDYYKAGGSDVQLNALFGSGKLTPKDRLRLSKAVENMQTVTRPSVNTAAVREAIASLPKGKIRNVEAAMSNLIREAIGEKLTTAQRKQVDSLHAAGVPELVLPENILQETSDARMLGMEISPEGIIEAKADISETIQKITKQILCRAI